MYTGHLHVNLILYYLDEAKSVLRTDGWCADVPELQSTQEDADTRLILHALHSVQHDGVKQVIVHANDTDVIVICIYDACKMQNQLPEVWVRSGPDSYLPIHLIAQSLGETICLASSTASVEKTSPSIHTSPARMIGSWQAANWTSKLWQTMERPNISFSLMS